jgi:hypothetical protein
MLVLVNLVLDSSSVETEFVIGVVRAIEGESL